MSLFRVQKLQDSRIHVLDSLPESYGTHHHSKKGDIEESTANIFDSKFGTEGQRRSQHSNKFSRDRKRSFGKASLQEGVGVATMGSDQLLFTNIDLTKSRDDAAEWPGLTTIEILPSTNDSDHAVVMKPSIPNGKSMRVVVTATRNKLSNLLVNSHKPLSAKNKAIFDYMKTETDSYAPKPHQRPFPVIRNPRDQDYFERIPNFRIQMKSRMRLLPKYKTTPLEELISRMSLPYNCYTVASITPELLHFDFERRVIESDTVRKRHLSQGMQSQYALMNAGNRRKRAQLDSHSKACLQADLEKVRERSRVVR